MRVGKKKYNLSKGYKQDTRQRAKADFAGSGGGHRGPGGGHPQAAAEEHPLPGPGAAGH